MLLEAGLGFLGAAQRNDTCLEDTGPLGSGRTWTCHGTRGWSARVSLLTRRTASRFPWRSPTATSGLSPWCSLPSTALLPAWVGMGGSWLISKSHNPWPQGCRATGSLPGPPPHLRHRGRPAGSANPAGGDRALSLLWHPSSGPTDPLFASSCFFQLGKSPTALGSASSQVASLPLSANSELLMWARGMGTTSPTLPLRGARPVGPLRPWEGWVLQGHPTGEAIQPS